MVVLKYFMHLFYLCLKVTLEDTYRNGFADFVMLPTTNFENSGDTIDYADIVQIQNVKDPNSYLNI